MTEELWEEMLEYARNQGWKGGNFKKLNLPFENKLLGQSREVRERMARRVEEFVYHLLTDVFNAGDTAPIAIDLILDAGSYDLGPKARKVEDEAEWTPSKIREKARAIMRDRGPEGDFDD